MREIDLKQVVKEDLIDYETLAKAFKDYLMAVLLYSESEADFVVESDFNDPYDTPFIMQEYEGTYTIDGKKYEVCSCCTDFCACGLFYLAEMPPFEFLMFFDLESLSDRTVGSYRKAKKLYLL